MQFFARHPVKDFDTWYAVLIEQMPHAAKYGVTLERVWQNAEDPNEVSFLLNIQDKASMEAFMASPESVESGERAGAMEGEFYYLVPYDG